MVIVMMRGVVAKRPFFEVQITLERGIAKIRKAQHVTVEPVVE